MPANSRRRSGGHARAKKRGYYWDGLQWPSTTLTTAGVAFVLVDTTAQEFMPATVERVRGFISYRCFHATETGIVGMKVMYVEVNDAQTITGDHAAFDTHEEDIAQRQLWTHHGMVGALDEPGPNVITIEVDIKVKIKLEPHGKKLLILFAEVTTANAVASVGYLRVLLAHG